MGWSYSRIRFLVAQVGYTAITARLVRPSAYGGYALALTDRGPCWLVRAGGLEQPVMQFPNSRTWRPDRPDARRRIRGVVVGASDRRSSGPIEYVLRTAGTGQMLRILAVQPPMIGLRPGSPMDLLRRGQRYQAASLIDLGSITGTGSLSGGSGHYLRDGRRPGLSLGPGRPRGGRHGGWDWPGPALRRGRPGTGPGPATSLPSPPKSPARISGTT